MTRGPDDPSDPESAPGSGGPAPGDPAPDEHDPTVEAFDAIVADWRRGGAPAWPGDDRPATDPPRVPPQPVPPARPGPGVDAPSADTPPAPVPTGEPDGHHDHFVPPEPPPLPRVGPPALVGATLLALGLVLVTLPSLVGVPEVYGLPLGLLTLAAGLGWFVLRLWPDPPADRGEDDDGAQV